MDIHLEFMNQWNSSDYLINKQPSSSSYSNNIPTFSTFMPPTTVPVTPIEPTATAPVAPVEPTVPVTTVAPTEPTVSITTVTPVESTVPITTTSSSTTSTVVSTITEIPSVVVNTDIPKYDISTYTDIKSSGITIPVIPGTNIIQIPSTSAVPAPVPTTEPAAVPTPEPLVSPTVPVSESPNKLKLQKPSEVPKKGKSKKKNDTSVPVGALNSITAADLKNGRSTLRKVNKEQKTDASEAFQNSVSSLILPIAQSLSAVINNPDKKDEKTQQEITDAAINNALLAFENMLSNEAKSMQGTENSNLEENNENEITEIPDLRDFNYTTFTKRMVKLLLQINSKVIDEDNIFTDLIKENIKNISFIGNEIIPNKFSGYALLIEKNVVYIVTLVNGEIMYLENPVSSTSFISNKLFTGILEKLENDNTLPIIFDEYKSLTKFENESFFNRKKLTFGGMK